MAEGNYRLQIKVGTAEFSAEGPEARVKEDYERFLDALKQTPQPKVPPAERRPGEEGGEGESGETISESMLREVFGIDENGIVVSLRILPQGSGNKEADCVIMLLYGFRRLLSQSEVPVTRIMDGLRLSGVPVARLDRAMGGREHLVLKGGTRSGGRYRLNNQGIIEAEKLLRGMLA